MSYQVQIEDVEAQRIAVVRRRAKQSELSRVVPEACGEVWNFVKTARIEHAGRHVAIYLDGEINMEIGVEVSQPFKPAGQVISSCTPSGRVAWTAHVGPYHLLGHAHKAIQIWCDKQKESFAGPSWEIYGHGSDDPSKTRTEVYYLLRERPSSKNSSH
jgi:effector-binding domain-containing protein